MGVKDESQYVTREFYNAECDRHNQAIARISVELDTMKERVTRLETRVGGPEEGVIARVDSLEKKIGELGETLRRMEVRGYLVVGGAVVVFWLLDKGFLVLSK